MSANFRRTVVAAAAALLVLNGGAANLARLAGFNVDWISGAVAAESGGHDSGGHSGGSGKSGGSHDSGGHTSGGHDSGGHASGSDKWGAEEKGHGLKLKHQGHAAGTHESGQSAHDAGAHRFAGGSGTSAGALVPEGLGRYGAGAPSEEGRLRYWGGWSLPEDLDPGTTIASTDLVPDGAGAGASINVRSTLQSAARCDDAGVPLTTAQRFSAPNLNRIRAARALLDADTGNEPAGDKAYLLANFQEELERPAPDLTLAGVYVGLVAKQPVTADKVKSVGARLCVRVGDKEASEIARAAEQQRVALK